MEVTIREVKIEDADGVRGVLNPIIEQGKFTVIDTPFSLVDEQTFIRQFPQRGVFKVAVSENQQVLGFQNVKPFASYTQAFAHVGVIGTYVDEQIRGMKIASSLFAETFASARNKGYEKLFAYVREDNPKALAVYLNQVFEVIGTAKKHAYMKGRYIDEVLIEKFL
ncbi:GNAT family N-acetyltransferase [Vibrio sp. T11.5]|uniref:GNAT family N-acetyltransferase n=1 Tax=Vibrio sp. T11.5 TaxID=2998836 RepID=UPI0022CD839D|nr:GNAT family N-acetyltransferase [Vibrio sp. T11.5]MDA0119474.1 GNAT family N-acetyltransferase [Vibrio sp. T11.5]